MQAVKDNPVPTSGTSPNTTERKKPADPFAEQQKHHPGRKAVDVEQGPVREWRYSVEVSTDPKGLLKPTIKARGDDLDDVLDDIEAIDRRLKKHFGTRIAGC